MKPFYFLFLSLLFSKSSSSNPEGKKDDWVNFHCKGEIEFVLEDRTRVDCLTDTHAIEYDWSNKWAEEVGQALYYSAMTEKEPSLVLICKNSNCDKGAGRAMKAAPEVQVWVINKGE